MPEADKVCGGVGGGVISPVLGGDGVKQMNVDTGYSLFHSKANQYFIMKDRCFSTAIFLKCIHL